MTPTVNTANMTGLTSSHHRRVIRPPAHTVPAIRPIRHAQIHPGNSVKDKDTRSSSANLLAFVSNDVVRWQSLLPLSCNCAKLGVIPVKTSGEVLGVSSRR